MIVPSRYDLGRGYTLRGDTTYDPGCTCTEWGEFGDCWAHPPGDSPQHAHLLWADPRGYAGCSACGATWSRRDLATSRPRGECQGGAATAYSARCAATGVTS